MDLKFLCEKSNRNKWQMMYKKLRSGLEKNKAEKGAKDVELGGG